jgi:hypothetical protein
MGFKVAAGFEMFRLHRVRVQVGVDLYFPGSRSRGTKTTYDYPNIRTEEVSARSSYPVMHVKVAF